MACEGCHELLCCPSCSVHCCPHGLATKMRALVVEGKCPLPPAPWLVCPSCCAALPDTHALPFFTAHCSGLDTLAQLRTNTTCNVRCTDLVLAFSGELLRDVDLAQAFQCPHCACRIHVDPGGNGALQCPGCMHHSCLFCAELSDTCEENRAHALRCASNPNAGALFASQAQLRALRHPHVKRAVLAFLQKRHQRGDGQLLRSVKARVQGLLRVHFGFELSKEVMSEARQLRRRSSD
jgi:hypothetical protein